MTDDTKMNQQPHSATNPHVRRWRLGRRAIKTDSRTLRLANYFTSALPPPPPTADWTAGITGWGMMLNDSIGDCTCAGLGHSQQVASLGVGAFAMNSP